MAVIYKYPLSLTPNQDIVLPSEHTLLCLQMQGNTPCIWAEVGTNSPLVIVSVTFAGTGETAPEGLKYLGTVQTSFGVVLHAYYEHIR